MTSEPHKSIKFVYLHVIDSAINTVKSLQNQRDPREHRLTRRALENLALNHTKVSPFDSQDEGMVDNDLADVFDVDQVLSGLAGGQGILGKSVGGDLLLVL